MQFRRVFTELAGVDAKSIFLYSFCGLLCACAGSGGGSTHLVSALPAVAAVPVAATTAVSAPQSTPARQSGAGAVASPAAISPAVTAPPTSAAAGASLPVQLTYRLPATVQTQSLRRSKQLYISGSNATITISVTPLGGSPVTTGPTACTSASCSVNFTATPGPNTITFTLQDGSANTLSTFSTIAVIQNTAANVLSYTSNPIVNSVTLSLGNATPNAGAAYNDPLTIAAKDADGNTIVGNTNYVDANGNPLSLLLTVTNSQAGGKGSVAIQGAAGINGSIMAYSLQAGAAPRDIVFGPDGTLWFTEQSKNVIGRVTTAGAVTEYTANGINGASGPVGITVGPDGNIWFAESGSNSIAKFVL